MNGISVWGALLCIAIVYFAVYGVLARLNDFCGWVLEKLPPAEDNQE